MNLTDVLKLDKLWQMTKKKTAKMDIDRKLSRSEFVQFVGADMYSEKAYQEYLKEYQEQKEKK